MFAQMMAASGGGSSVKSGTTEATAYNTEIEIDTGLSQVNQFAWFAEASNSIAGKAVVLYDRNTDSGKFTASRIATTQGTYNGTIGSAPTAYIPSMTGLSGGVVKIKTASTANYGSMSAGYWFSQ